MSGDWLTYAEAAERLGIKPESVKKRAIRKGWPRQQGNDGLARICLPDGTHVSSHVPDAVSSHVPRDMSGDDTRERLASAETEVRLLRERLADLTADRERWRHMAERLSHLRIGFFSRLFRRDQDLG